MSTVVILLLLLLATAFFSATELAVTMGSRVRTRTRAEKGSRLAALAEHLLTRPERTIALSLVGSNLVSVAIAVYARQALLAVAPLREPLADIVTTIIVVPLVVLWGEIVPKAVAQNYPNRVLRAVVLPLQLARVLLLPLLWLAVGVSEIVGRLAGVRARAIEFASREELKQFVARSEMRGHVGSGERELIYRIFEFWKVDPLQLVRAVHELPHLDDDATVAQAERLMRERQLVRLLITDRARGHVVGVVRAARLLGIDPGATLGPWVEPPARVDLGAGLDAVLAALQQSPSQVALVPVAETTGPAVPAHGVILLDDVLDRLLGELPAAETALPRAAAGERRNNAGKKRT